MNRYFIKLVFDGSAYHGWQVQDNASSVQAKLNDSLSTILQEKIETAGCGRTDAGVHAREFYAHFDSLKEQECEALIKQLNKLLPKDIALSEIFQVKEDAHARFSALSRSYQYHIVQKKDPFMQDRVHYVYGKLDIEKMNDASKVLFEYEDFSSFCKSRTQNKTNICRVMEAGWRQECDLLVFHITANRFLRNMVRAIVGSMIEIGQGKMDVNQFRKVIESKDRSQAGASVPGCGLYLVKVKYPGNIQG